jgi:hypothetical protein
MSGGRYNGRLDGLQLPGITGQDHLRAAFLSQADQVGQVGGGDHRGLVDQQQDALGDIERPAAAALAGQVTQELGGVVRLGHAPDPAGALITETRLPSVSTDSTAAD